ncbi:MAG: phenylalanine--tRNA ligase subunit beta, partial [Mycobacterium leprae]
GDDHSGILVLPRDTPLGADVVTLLGLRDAVLDLEINPDRGYALSIRGVAREAAIAFDTGFRDPAHAVPPTAAGDGWAVRIDDRAGCDVYVAHAATGLDVAAPAPLPLQRRLQLAGMRPISLAVDVTNYVMLELGQPLHAFDRVKLSGAIVVRRAAPAEKLTTLDGVARTLDPDDLVITDDSGPIALAGVMGGAATEISDTTRDVLIEAAHFDPASVARGARRHRLPSEASRRFERGVDPAVAEAAAARAVALLRDLGGATPDPAVTVVRHARPRVAIRMPVTYPSRLTGHDYPPDVVRRRLDQVGCAVAGRDVLEVTPPSWRPDLGLPADLVEEVARLEGYDAVPSVLPTAPAGRGLTRPQRLRRRVGRALAGAGFVEVGTYPFLSAATWDALGLGPDDPRRRTLTLTNPLSDEEPALRSTLLPGLLRVLALNVGRGQSDVALFETGLVFLPRPGTRTAPRLGVDRGPTAEELAALEAALPDQPQHAAVVLAGTREPAGWWGPGRRAGWADAVEAARVAAAAVRAPLTVHAADVPPWHAGRCAALQVGDRVVGHAGELHPRVVAALSVPERTCAMELDLDAVLSAAEDTVPAPRVSPYPVATLDVALSVSAGVPAAEVETAMREGAGPLLESVRLFDLFTGAQAGEGRKSLAFTLRLRAPDRTLTTEEAAGVRDAAVAEAARRTGAVLRGT